MRALRNDCFWVDFSDLGRCPIESAKWVKADICLKSTRPNSDKPRHLPLPNALANIE